jgi:hypothetical protein
MRYRLIRHSIEVSKAGRPVAPAIYPHLKNLKPMPPARDAGHPYSRKCKKPPLWWLFGGSFSWWRLIYFQSSNLDGMKWQNSERQARFGLTGLRGTIRPGFARVGHPGISFPMADSNVRDGAWVVDRAQRRRDQFSLMPCSPTMVKADRRWAVPRSMRTCLPIFISSKLQPADRAET